MIEITNSALELIRTTKASDNIRDDVGIRITALCFDDLGPSYDIRFAMQAEDDHVFGPEGTQVFIQQETFEILYGGTFGTADSYEGLSFQITNPNYVREISSSGGCSSGGCSSEGGCSSGGCSSDGGCSSGGCGVK